MGVYNDMNKGRFRHNLYQMVTAPDFGFYQMMPHNHIKDSSGQKLSEAKHGNWKFHLSIDPKDVPLAWDIVADRLMNDGYAHIAKVTKPEVSESFANPNSIQAGKQITLYTFEDISPDVYKDLISDIETRLDQAGIKAGPPSNADRIIPGAKYAGYRSDKDQNGQYIGSSDIKNLPRSQRHNPFNQQDPYKNFSLNNDLNRQGQNYGQQKEEFSNVNNEHDETSFDGAGEGMENNSDGAMGVFRAAMIGRGLGGIIAIGVMSIANPVFGGFVAATAAALYMGYKHLEKEQNTKLRHSQWENHRGENGLEKILPTEGKGWKSVQIEIALRREGIAYSERFDDETGQQIALSVSGRDNIEALNEVLSRDDEQPSASVPRGERGYAASSFHNAAAHQERAPRQQRQRQHQQRTDRSREQAQFKPKDWVDVNSRSGAAKYFVLDGKSQVEQAQMHERLQQSGIDYEQKRSSLNGGCDVLSVSGARDVNRLNSMMDTNNRQNTGPTTQPLQQQQQTFNPGFGM